MQLVVSIQGNSSPPPILREIFGETAITDQVPATGTDVLVRWGNTEGSSRAPLVFNRRKALENALDPDRRREFLQASGIPYRPELRRQNSRGYRVDLFDLIPITIVRPSVKSQRPDEMPGGSKLYKLLCHLATRTLYCLGLDFGRVEIRVTAKKPAVVSIDPAPVPLKGTAERWRKAIETAVSEFFSNRIPATLGADPEFLLIHTASGRVIPASDYLPVRGPVGCDARVVNLRGRSRPLAELRPNPASSPAVLVGRLRKLLRKAKKMITDPGIEWRAGCMPVPGYPVGGHIHFGGVRPSSRLLRTLDTYFGLLLMLLENSAAGRRRRAKYGFLGDFRLQPHGFEYRTPGSWLISPRIAKAALCLAWFVSRNYRLLDRDAFLEPDLAADFYQGRKNGFMDLANLLWDDLGTLPDFKTFAPDINVIKELVLSKKRWKENTDIKNTWLTKSP